MTADENRRIEVFERELWRIAVEHLDYGEQIQWAALAGARVAPNGWRRARAMLHFDQGGELKRTFLLTAVQRNKNPQLRAARAAGDRRRRATPRRSTRAVEMVGGWPRDEQREGVKVVLQALAEKKIGRRDQANNWIWRLRRVHARGARGVRRPALAGDQAPARAARQLVAAARTRATRAGSCTRRASRTGACPPRCWPRRSPHTAEAGEVVNGARTRMSRKPGALARELLRNFPKGKSGRRGSRRRKKKSGAAQESQIPVTVAAATDDDGTDLTVEDAVDTVEAGDAAGTEADEQPKPKPRRSRRRAAKTVDADPGDAPGEAAAEAGEGDAPEPEEPPKPERTRRRTAKPAEAEANTAEAEEPPKPKRTRRTTKPAEAEADTAEAEEPPKPKRTRRTTKPAAAEADTAEAEEPPKPKRTRRRTTKAAEAKSGEGSDETPAKSTRARARKPAKTAAEDPGSDDTAPAPEAVTREAKRTRRTRTTKKSVDDGEAVPNGSSPLEEASERVRAAVLKLPANDEAA